MLLFVFDWRLGLLSLVPVALGFLIMVRMTGAGMQEKMKEYQNALDDMANQAVEYVRGIPVVKTFGQTIHSFRQFKDSIDRYRVWVIAYTKELRAPMLWYTTAINRVFAFLIAGGLALTQGGGRPGLPAGPAFLHHHHAGDCPHPHPNHVPERERHDCG